VKIPFRVEVHKCCRVYVATYELVDPTSGERKSGSIVNESLAEVLDELSRCCSVLRWTLAQWSGQLVPTGDYR
jgi:hypothetical protein